MYKVSSQGQSLEFPNYHQAQAHVNEHGGIVQALQASQEERNNLGAALKAFTKRSKSHVAKR